MADSEMNGTVNMVSPTQAPLKVPKEEADIDAEVGENSGVNNYMVSTGALKEEIGENEFEEDVNQPPQLVSYEDIVADNDLFQETLLALYEAFDTNLEIPKFGSTPLDLHKLFIEVTARGGMQKVTEDRKWMQVARAVLVSPFSSNVSFSLRTKYNTILYIYELLYYFRAGSLIMNDYLVIPNPTPTPISIRRRRRPSRPPTYPKKFKTGYLYYFTEQFSKMKPSTFEMGQELAKKIGYQWRNLSPSEKSVYLEMGEIDRERYKNEMRIYHSSQRLVMIEREPQE
ncbi:hypothetical protein ZOSMA_33G01230 [Zostera marina]|uniref:Uncharacterized protein n=1 Tax=Zostera marina TaxID=29655 RepID=A0A0K9PA83_ZOSMR|nr:hypothetical protein ZOSMA_33G01230 [Zostera marina]